MLDVTDRHFRVFLRLLSRHTKLYTEMTVSNALLRGQRARFLAFTPCERPLALQLGGAEPAQLAHCARLAAAAGYDEVNLNIGCPSTRVKNGQFGACLMAKPDLVARCVAAMRAALRATGATIPVTVKSRIGLDHRDRYEDLAEFVATVSRSGCEHFIIHARKAWLNGLSPKQNRCVPPLQYERVYRLKQDFPHLRLTINGGIKTLSEAAQHLQRVDGVMIGRAAWRDPWLLHAVDRVIFNAPMYAGSARQTRTDLLNAYAPYVAQQLAQGVRLRLLLRPLLGLFHGQPGASSWRRRLTELATQPEVGLGVITQALTAAPEPQHKQPPPWPGGESFATETASQLST